MALIKHFKTGRIGEIIKENAKTFSVKTLKEGYETIYENVLWKKQDVDPYTEPVKEKSFYDKMREKNMEDAKNLPTSPQEASQTILWLKMAIIDRIEKIENRTNDELHTFRDSNGKFGFTEGYVNILMQMAYDEGHKKATNDLSTHHKNQISNMKLTIDKIIDTLEEGGFIDNECNCY